MHDGKHNVKNTKYINIKTFKFVCGTSKLELDRNNQAKLHSTKSELSLYTGSNPTRGV